MVGVTVMGWSGSLSPWGEVGSHRVGVEPAEWAWQKQVGHAPATHIVGSRVIRRS